MAEPKKEGERQDRETRMSTLQKDLELKRKRLEEIQKAREDLQRKKLLGLNASSPSTEAPGLLDPFGGDQAKPVSTGRRDSANPFSAFDRIARQVEERDESAGSATAAVSRAPPKLSKALHILWDIPPVRCEKYSKETQTDLGSSAPRAVEDDELVDTTAGAAHSPMRPQKTSGGPVSPGAASQAAVDDTVKRQPETGLSERERKRIISSPQFAEFLNRSSLIVERALNVKFDVILDDRQGPVNQKEPGEKLRVKEVFFDEKWSKGKAVTAISFNPKNPELFLASYYGRHASKEPRVGKYSNSCVLVWSEHLPQRAAFVFQCQSDIAQAFYCRYRPHMIIGSTYSGQIVLWDTRQGQDPVHRSALSSESHTHPVFGLNVVGTSNSHELVSLSTDGRFCVWNLDNLGQPQECVDLCQLVDVGDSRVKKDITACTLSFAEQEFNKFFVGSEDGGLYSGNRHGSSSRITEKYEGHVGPITGTHCHPNTGGSVDFSDLILTSSMDWTCKLWSQRHNKYLASFEEFQEYVYDARWSPIHPSLFASVDGTGELQIWNLGVTMEVPVARINATGGHAANQLSWSLDGRHVAVGDLKGQIQYCEVPSSISVPAPDDWQKFDTKLSELLSGI
eukprot:TRINITY_DN11032_c0_g2_i1.p1 TRINITY_DN11032_c0_g2~~TRINITY_DN11032_c0_g2_i1.p1  ORF type:complete len:623 (-),score=118.08 TRINITY_DN11032_c0_g2_i1:105-1973(-)